MFFGFQLTCGLMLVFYGYSVMKNPRVWGDQGRQAVKAENFPEYCRQNGLFFLKAGSDHGAHRRAGRTVHPAVRCCTCCCICSGWRSAFYPLVKWCRENEGFSWPWPQVESEKKRIQKAASTAGKKKKTNNAGYAKGTPHGVPFCDVGL